MFSFEAHIQTRNRTLCISSHQKYIHICVVYRQCICWSYALGFWDVFVDGNFKVPESFSCIDYFMQWDRKYSLNCGSICVPNIPIRTRHANGKIILLQWYCYIILPVSRLGYLPCIYIELIDPPQCRIQETHTYILDSFRGHDSDSTTACTWGRHPIRHLPLFARKLETEQIYLIYFQRWNA